MSAARAIASVLLIGILITSTGCLQDLLGSLFDFGGDPAPSGPAPAPEAALAGFWQLDQNGTATKLRILIANNGRIEEIAFLSGGTTTTFPADTLNATLRLVEQSVVLEFTNREDALGVGQLGTYRFIASFNNELTTAIGAGELVTASTSEGIQAATRLGNAEFYRL